MEPLSIDILLETCSSSQVPSRRLEGAEPALAADERQPHGLPAVANSDLVAEAEAPLLWLSDMVDFIEDDSIGSCSSRSWGSSDASTPDASRVDSANLVTATLKHLTEESIPWANGLWETQWNWEWDGVAAGEMMPTEEGTML